MIKISKPDLKIREILSRKKKELEGRILQLTKEDPFQDKERLIDNASSDTEAREEVGHDRIEALKQELLGNIARIKQALGILKSGKYGKCVACDTRIDIKRLKIFPEATFCVECEHKKEAGT